MSADIIQFIPRPNPDRAKREAEVQQQAADLMHQVLFGAPLHSDHGLTIPYQAPEKDPA
jgi:hypothetical protein